MARRVLVVDDSPTIRQQLRMTLSGAGFSVDCATDGQEGLDRLRADRGFHLVITDMNMPNMDGATMLEQAQAEGLTKGLPIVVLTTEGHPQLVARCKKAGARGWMVKPTKPKVLVKAAMKLTRAA